MLKEELINRQIPELLKLDDGSLVDSVEGWQVRRKEIVELLEHEFTGVTPALKPKTEGIVRKTDDRGAFAGKAVWQQIDICCDTMNGPFTFPCHLVVPKAVEKPPVFLYISFSPGVVDELLPMEEILDQGYAVACFYYQDIVPDSDDQFRNGLAKLSQPNPFDGWGKVAMWSFAASRVMDYLQTLENIDSTRVAVIGHSRLGKTALWCGAMDERFSMVISNDSGGAGAALFRGKTGEMIKNLNGTLSHYWYCGNFFRYVKRESELPFDMHYLLSLTAPRHLYVCSAFEDGWADPLSELLGVMAASPAFELYGDKGFVGPEEFPKEETTCHEGRIGYHIRKGTHFLSRYDWNRFIEYRKKHDC